jgi:hypothetical protein
VFDLNRDENLSFEEFLSAAKRTLPRRFAFSSAALLHRGRRFFRRHRDSDTMM